MTTEQTFSMWYGEVIAKWYAQDNQRLGQLFINELHASGRHALANSFCFTTDDPFHSNTVGEHALAYVERNWDSPLAR